MSDGCGPWEIPVVTKDGRAERATLTVTVVDGQVVGIPPKEPFVIPPDSDDALCDALREARRRQLNQLWGQE